MSLALFVPRRRVKQKKTIRLYAGWYDVNAAQYDDPSQSCSVLGPGPITPRGHTFWTSGTFFHLGISGAAPIFCQIMVFGPAQIETKQSQIRRLPESHHFGGLEM